MKTKIGIWTVWAFFSFVPPVYMQEIWLEFSEPSPARGSVNSYAEESYPFFTRGNDFYFVRSFHQDNEGGLTGGQDIWKAYTNREFSKFVGATNSLEKLNNAGNNAVVGISGDGKKLFLLNIFPGKEGPRPGFSFSEKTEEGWTAPQPMNVPTVNLRGDYYSAHVTRDGDLIFISMSGDSTAGGHDIYVMYRDETGWNGPVHTGPVLNSAGEEISPYFHDSTGMLFFSSSGLEGAAGQDIYYARHIPGNAWTAWDTPRRLPLHINSPGFEGYFTCSADSVCAFTSSRNSVLGDIYFTTMKVKTAAGTGPEIIHETVVIRDTIYEQANMAIEKPSFPNKITQFEYNKAVLSPQTNAILDSVTAFLALHPGSRVILSGHTCDKGSEVYNNELSRKRAEAVKEELVKKGVQEDRILVRWYASRKPLVPNTDDAGREKNRRVEIDFLTEK